MKLPRNRVGCECNIPEDLDKDTYRCSMCLTLYKRNRIVFLWYVEFMPTTAEQYVMADLEYRKEQKNNDRGSTSLSIVFLLLTMAFVLALLGAIGSQMEDSKSKLTCNPATKQVDGSFASNCDSYGEYYDNGAP